MFKLTIEAATYAELQQKLAEAAGGAPAPAKSTAAATAKAAATAAKSDPTPPTVSEAVTTPEPAKVETSGADGNSQGLTVEQFSKMGMDFAKACGDNGAKLKEIWANFQQADGSPVNRLSTVQTKDYDAFLAALDEAALT